jgi:hypothetical protein
MHITENIMICCRDCRFLLVGLDSTPLNADWMLLRGSLIFSYVDASPFQLKWNFPVRWNRWSIPASVCPPYLVRSKIAPDVNNLAVGSWLLHVGRTGVRATDIFAGTFSRSTEIKSQTLLIVTNTSFGMYTSKLS